MNVESYSEDEYEQILSYIYSFKGQPSSRTQAEILRYVIDFKCGIRSKVAKLKVIQITGTDGKGSVCAYLEEMLFTSGIPVLTFTSPHINTIRERIKIDKKLITKSLLIEKVEELRPLLEELRGTSYHLGPFQIIFLICLILHCERVPNHWGIYEVAIGGNSDETNVFDSNIVGLTTITGDHATLFGGFDQLVREKIGLAKPGSILFSQKQYPRTYRLMHEFATRKDLKIFFVRQEVSVFEKEYLIPGPYQAASYYLARNILSFLAENYSLKIDVKLIKQVKLIGRSGSFAIGQRKILYDTAHTEKAIRALLLTISKRQSQKKLIFACSLKRTSKTLIRSLFTLTSFVEIYFTQIMSYGGTPAVELKKEANDLGYLNCWATNNLYNALKLALEQGESADVYIFGSFRLMRDIDPSLLKMGLSPQLSSPDDIDPPQSWYRLLK